MMDIYNQRVDLKQKILSLSNEDWKHICRLILIPNNENLTINRSGVCFCMMKLSDKSIESIQKYIENKNIIMNKQQSTEQDNDTNKTPPKKNPE